MTRLHWIGSLIFFIWATCASSGEASAGVRTTDAHPRVAVLCEQQDTELLGLSEQVEVRLAQRNDMVLLDRANMDQVLREQGLLAKGAQDMETIVRIGKLLRTDLLVVAGKYEGFLAWRFIDVKNGVLAGLHVIRWPAEQRSVAASELERAIVTTTRQIGTDAVEGKRYLSIVRFVNQDLSRQYDSLEEVLPVLLSAQLAFQPGIGLVERSRLNKVAEEKTGTEGAEGGYKAGTLIVKGEISILRSNATPSVSVAVSAGKPNQPATIRFTCVGQPEDVRSLARVMQEQLLKAMEVKTQETSSTDTVSEADTFYLKGNFCMAQTDLVSALSLYKTACLLNPTNDLYQTAYRNARRGILKQQVYEPIVTKNFIGRRDISQQVLLRYYIEDVDDWKARFCSGGITPENISQDEGWYYTDCIGMGEPKQELLAEPWRIAYDGYRTLLDRVFDYCKTNNAVPSKELRRQLGVNLFQKLAQHVNQWKPNVYPNRLQMYFFTDPLDVCRYFRKYVDSEYPYRDRTVTRTLTAGGTVWTLSCFATRLMAVQAEQTELEDYTRVVFDHLIQDDNPLIRVWAKAALIRTGFEGEMFVLDGRSDIGQSIVDELALWNSPTRTNGHPQFVDIEPVAKNALLYLIQKNRRDILPAVESIRQALKKPGASYTPALDAFVHQLLRQHDPKRFADIRISSRKGKLLTESGSSSRRTSFFCKSQFEPITTPYHAWTDILCQHVDFQLKGGKKDETIKEVETIFRAETLSDEAERAAGCMSQITEVLKYHQPRYGYDIASITNVIPLASAAVPEGVQYATVAWHINKEEISNRLFHHEVQDYHDEGDVVVKDDKILYYKYESPLRCGAFDVTIIDLATGQIVQTLRNQESLRYREGPNLGIPKQEVLSWCEMDGRYYVGCVGGFGEFHNGIFTLLASSRKEQTGRPLDGGESYTVTGIRPNHASKKLYLLVQGGPKRDGIWEYTPATAGQKRVIDLRGKYFYKPSWDDTYLYIPGYTFGLAFNTHAPDESFVTVRDNCPGTLSNREFWKGRGLRDIRFIGKDQTGSGNGGWNSLAVMGSNAIYTYLEVPGVKIGNFIWKAGEARPRRLILLDKQGREVASTNCWSDISVKHWRATPRGFLYQLQGGGLGLLSDREALVEPQRAPVAGAGKEKVEGAK